MLSKTLVRFAFAAVMLTTVYGTVGSAIAQGVTPPEEIRLDVDLKDANMVDATRMLTMRTGLKFIFEPGSENFPKITLRLPGVTAEEALTYICKAAGAFYRRDEAGVYIISNKVMNDPVIPSSDLVNSPKLPALVKKVKLRKADARDIMERLYGNQPDPNRTFGDINTFKRLTEFVTMKDPKNNLAVLHNDNSYRPMPTQNYGQAQGGTESGNNIALPGESGGQLGFGGGGQGGLGGGGQGFGGGGQGFGGGGQGGQGQQTNLQGGQGLVPTGIDFISYDPTDNSLVVRGTEEAIAELQRMIALFDVAPKQVEIKVEFITTSSSLSKALGYDFLYQRGTIFFGNRPGTFARTNDPIFLNFATGNITMRMRTLLTEGIGKTVQAPIVRTLNNQPASIFQFITTTIFINTVVSVGNGQVIIAPSPQQISVQTGLQVAPRINDDNTITMSLSPVVQDFGQLRRGPNGEEIPDQLGQQIAVVARVKNGETIVLGGLTRKQETGSHSRFPILGDLPIIGQFFRSNTREKNNQELLIFVTPRIIEDEESGG
ncbi:MAG: hypothetical protein WAO58_13735 [Fimbriimonadaceae bacterium]